MGRSLQSISSSSQSQPLALSPCTATGPGGLGARWPCAFFCPSLVLLSVKPHPWLRGFTTKPRQHCRVHCLGHGSFLFPKRGIRVFAFFRLGTPVALHGFQLLVVLLLPSAPRAHGGLPRGLHAFGGGWSLNTCWGFSWGREHGVYQNRTGTPPGTVAAQT